MAQTLQSKGFTMIPGLCQLLALVYQKLQWHRPSRNLTPVGQTAATALDKTDPSGF